MTQLDFGFFNTLLILPNYGVMIVIVRSAAPLVLATAVDVLEIHHLFVRLL